MSDRFCRWLKGAHQVLHVASSSQRVLGATQSGRRRRHGPVNHLVQNADWLLHLFVVVIHQLIADGIEVSIVGGCHIGRHVPPQGGIRRPRGRLLNCVCVSHVWIFERVRRFLISFVQFKS